MWLDYVVKHIIRIDLSNQTLIFTIGTSPKQIDWLIKYKPKKKKFIQEAIWINEIILLYLWC